MRLCWQNKFCKQWVFWIVLGDFGGGERRKLAQKRGLKRDLAPLEVAWNAL
jgi:hypothetical protein